MIVGVTKETFPQERRVALVPTSIPALTKAGIELVLEAGAGVDAGYPNALYIEKGVRVVDARAELFQRAEVVFQVRTFGANLEAGAPDLKLLRSGQVLIGMFDPLYAAEAIEQIAKTGATALALELLPRITRAQSMDVLSSMATVAGYKAVLLAAEQLPRMFPMLMTAAGTLTPARVFVIGAGVAGLEAIAIARRLGAVVEAFDLRPTVKEQIESLGAKFVELPLESRDAEDAGGYAKAQGESFYRRQQEVMARAVAQSDVVITTAAVPGQRAPVLITKEMVVNMAPGSVIVDLSADRGGNCELTQPNQLVVEHGVTILGPINLAATVPYHASQMYSRNISTFLLHLLKDGKILINLEDQITRETLLARGGEVVHPKILELLGRAPATAG
jgi:NAD(P) transhydrogenase subunit alpha